MSTACKRLQILPPESQFLSFTVNVLKLPYMVYTQIHELCVYNMHKYTHIRQPVCNVCIKVHDLCVAVLDRNRILFHIVCFEKMTIKVIYDYPGVLLTFELPLVVVLVLS